VKAFYSFIVQTQALDFDLPTPIVESLEDDIDDLNIFLENKEFVVDIH
jgi:hypothetical protein